jgi:hypothetical protein
VAHSTAGSKLYFSEILYKLLATESGRVSPKRKFTRTHPCRAEAESEEAKIAHWPKSVVRRSDKGSVMLYKCSASNGNGVFQVKLREKGTSDGAENLV